MDNSLDETSLQRIMVVIFIILDWMFVFINTTTNGWFAVSRHQKHKS